LLVATIPAYGTPAATAPEPGVATLLARGIGRIVDGLFGAVSTALLLAVIATVPVLQLFALGYLLNAAGRLAQTGRLRDGFPGVREASRIGQVVIGVWLVLLPWRLFASLARDAELIAPGAPRADLLAQVSSALGVLGVLVAIVALALGGQLRWFVRPIRAARELGSRMRAGGFVRQSRLDLRRFAGGFAVPRIFSLGLRGYLGAALWLLVPTTLIAIGRQGGLAVLGVLQLVIVLLFLPLLQIHFAVHGRLRRYLDVYAVVDLFTRAPLAFFVAFVSTLLFALPLYLLKIELVPRDALWLPAAVFVCTIFPCKLMAGWAYHRAATRTQSCHPAIVWPLGILLVPVAVLYAFVVFLTQYTGWHGVLGLYEHHAFLLPVPF
jgi:hypothetical protein